MEIVQKKLVQMNFFILGGSFWVDFPPQINGGAYMGVSTWHMKENQRASVCSLSKGTARYKCNTLEVYLTRSQTNLETLLGDFSSRSWPLPEEIGCE